MQINDVVGIGKVLPIDKLIDVISCSVGRVTKSYFDKKDAESKAYEIREVAKARAEEVKIIAQALNVNDQKIGGIEYNDGKIAISSLSESQTALRLTESFGEDLVERTCERVNYQQVKKQINIEKVTSYAADQLRDEPEVENQPINEDWLSRFFNIIEDVSSEDMQALWGKILAGEIIKPKSYSLRTLSVLKNLTKEDAEVFMKITHAKVSSNDIYFIYNPNHSDYLASEFGITYYDRLLLIELGLISGVSSVFKLKPTENKKDSDVLFYGTKAIMINRNENALEQTIPIISFTKVGVELTSLIEQKINLSYLKHIGLHFIRENAEVEYGDYKNLGNGQIELYNRVKIS